MSNLHDPNTATLSFHSALVNEFYLTATQTSTLDYHYLLHWSGMYLQHRIKNSPDGLLMHGDIPYILVLPVGVRNKFYESPHLKLSFRKPRAEYGIPPYVLVRFGSGELRDDNSNYS